MRKINSNVIQAVEITKNTVLMDAGDTTEDNVHMIFSVTQDANVSFIFNDSTTNTFEFTAGQDFVAGNDVTSITVNSGQLLTTE